MVKRYRVQWILMTGPMNDMETGRHTATKAKLNESKEIKVKVPVRLLLKLHFTKITESRLMGDLVTDALEQYFQGVSGDVPEAAAAGSGAENASKGVEETPATA